MDMDLLSGYGSDDSDASHGNEPSPKRTKREQEVSVRQGNTNRVARRRLGDLDKKKSRWTKTSAFLAPVGYDPTDAAEEEDNDDDKVTSMAKRTPRHTRPLLTSMLPAPTHVVQNKNAPSAPKSPVYERHTVESNISGYSRTIESAPNVGASVPARSVPAGTGNALLPEGVCIKEISGASLRGRGTESIADTSGMRAALGDEYERKLRSEAARVGNVSKLAKRKNQLSSLFVNAKAQEIEQMEKQASGVRTKTETQKKYGW